MKQAATTKSKRKARRVLCDQCRAKVEAAEHEAERKTVRIRVRAV